MLRVKTFAATLALFFPWAAGAPVPRAGRVSKTGGPHAAARLFSANNNPEKLNAFSAQQESALTKFDAFCASKMPLNLEHPDIKD
mmetsp:Transcript_6037/g.17044  ORF Transcript_6037/g.17044 Transcript_6037/m.17044 type:complete len:85 (+) Transcript_6037:518-772(+)